MLPQDCGGRQLNPWRLKSGSSGSSGKMPQSAKRLGLLRYSSKSFSTTSTGSDSMGSVGYVSRGEFRGWGSTSCSESRERDKRKILFLLSWLCCSFLVLLSDSCCRNIQTRRIWFCARYSWIAYSVGTFPSANQNIQVFKHYSIVPATKYTQSL